MSAEDDDRTPAAGSSGGTAARTELYDLRVVVDRIEGRSVCGMKVGDHIDLVESSRLCLPDGGHFCLYALQAVLPLLPAKQRRLPPGDWLERDDLVACPDPEERLIMRIERTGIRSIPTEDLT
ncbi:TIGR04076 family protein [Microbacterium aurantiacum]|uniref:TIGR04076 family protein n=1 Tax=Microbacterium aurantiacum TaxID=162393 RepID=UPI001F1845C4|nr:TIGR04076 family protein [Microbacterium aurantiacum]